MAHEIAPLEQKNVVQDAAPIVESTPSAPVVDTPVVSGMAPTSTDGVAAIPPTTTIPTTASTLPAADGLATEAPATGAVNTAPPAAATTGATEAPSHAAVAKDGVLGYKAPGLMSKIRYSKKYFWLGEEAIPASSLKQYIESEKSDIAHPNAAWSSQTGKGLLYFTKRQEDKATPSGLICLADITEVDKGPEKNEFSFKIHSKTHEFQAKDEAERDSWHTAIETSMYHAKGSKEDLVSSGPYKDSHASIAKGGAAVAGGAAAGGATAAAVSNKDKKTTTKDSKSKDRSESRRRSGVFAAFGKKEESTADKKEAEKKIEKDQKEADKAAAAAKKEDEKVAKENVEKEKSEKLDAEKKANEKEAEEKKAELAAGGVGAAGLVGAGAAAAHSSKEEPASEAAVADKSATTSPTTTSPAAKTEDAQPKSKRASMFGLFNRNKSPSPSKTSETTPATTSAVPVAATGDSTTEPAPTAPKGGISTFKGLNTAEPATAPTTTAVPETTSTEAAAPSAFADDPVSGPVPTTTGNAAAVTSSATDIAATGTPIGAVGVIEPGKADISQIVNDTEAHGPTGANPLATGEPPVLATDGKTSSSAGRRMSSFLGRAKKDQTTATEATTPVATTGDSVADPAAKTVTEEKKTTTEEKKAVEEKKTTEEKKPSLMDKIMRRKSKIEKKEPSPSPASRKAEPIAEAKADETPAVATTEPTSEATKVVDTTEAKAPTTNGTTGAQSIGDVVPEAVSRGEPAATKTAV